MLKITKNSNFNPTFTSSKSGTVRTNVIHVFMIYSDEIIQKKKSTKLELFFCHRVLFKFVKKLITFFLQKIKILFPYYPDKLTLYHILHSICELFYMVDCWFILYMVRMDYDQCSTSLFIM